MADRLLIFVPTYNEHENVEALLQGILALGLDADILFMDDNSPDGTGRILDKLAAAQPRMRVQHREGKLGIGSAHLDGIRYAYEHGYDKLLTMDCDFTHSPSDIPRLLAASDQGDVTLGSRFMRKGSLPGWTPMRRALTLFGHFLTKTFLQLAADASGALRVYDLRRIPRSLFEIVNSRSYSFFFESLFVLTSNGCTIKEIPIVLPARTYGHSKMSFWEATRSARMLVALWLEKKLNPGRFRPGIHVAVDPRLSDPQDWDPYWDKKREFSGFVYESIAALYRRLVIKRNLQYALRRDFGKGARLLHAGCGSGHVDEDLHSRYAITAVDISPKALHFYSQNNPRAAAIRHASILDLPFPDGSFDGVYNLGVLEHFSAEDIDRILLELRRVLRPDGKIVIFWPHRWATSVAVLKVAHILFHKFVNPDKRFHPPEPSLTRGRRETEAFLRRAGLELLSYSFGLRDLFVQAVVVGRKPGPVAESAVRKPVLVSWQVPYVGRPAGRLARTQRTLKTGSSLRGLEQR